jgi:holliday junction DNA helicase RuvA
MYSYIKGTLVHKTPTHVVLEAGSIGYEITIPVSTFDKLPKEEESVKLLTHFYVREDTQRLFGFFTKSELSLFLLLISVNGIGPRIALTILSGIPIKTFRQAIINQDLNILTSISGVGRKIAERTLIELREKVGLGTNIDVVSVASEQHEVMLGDAVDALVSLGYKHQSARQAIQKVLKRGQDLPTEELIREALKSV